MTDLFYRPCTIKGAEGSPFLDDGFYRPCTIKRFTAWTDGACEPNPGIGGWGFKLVTPDGQTIERFGGEVATTNNRMELTAALMVMLALPDQAEVTIFSDSTYVVKGMMVWRHGWRKKGWKRATGPIPNADLWQSLDEQAKRLQSSFEWVRGHAGDPGNERADELAAIGRLSLGVQHG